MRWQPVALTAVMMLSGAEQPEAIPTQAARIIIEAQESTNQVWPGFSLPARSFAIYTSAGTYLHTLGAAPEGFVRQGSLYYRSGPLPGFEGVLATALPLGDLRVTIVGAGRTAEATAQTLYHEAFHAFQQEAMLSTAAALDAGSLSITADQAASIEVERRLLREALQQRQAPQAPLIDALAVRRARTARGGESLAAAERIVERHEGLAEYVALMSMARALKRTPLTARAVVARSLELPLKTFGGSPDERLVRTRGYATGAAMAMLLDDLDSGLAIRCRRPTARRARGGGCLVSGGANRRSRDRGARQAWIRQAASRRRSAVGLAERDDRAGVQRAGALPGGRGDVGHREAVVQLQRRIPTRRRVCIGHALAC